MMVGRHGSGTKRCGETHQRAKHSDDTVKHVRDLHELSGWSNTEIARELHLPTRTVRKWISYERRALTVDNWKMVEDGRAGEGAHP